MPKPMSKSQRRRAKAQARKSVDKKKNPVVTVACVFCKTTRDVAPDADEAARMCAHCYRPMKLMELGT